MIPSLSAEEYQRLEQNILNDDCIDQFVLWNGNLIDGYNRHTIYTKHNLEFQTVDKSFDSWNDVCIWIIQNKLGRCNLPHFSRGEFGSKLKYFYQEKGIKNLKIVGKLYGENSPQNLELVQNSAKVLDGNTTVFDEREIKKIDTQEEIAKLSGVSPDTISNVEKN